MPKKSFYKIHVRKPLNVITLSQIISDLINQIITITCDFYLVIINKWDV